MELSNFYSGQSLDNFQYPCDIATEPKDLADYYIGGCKAGKAAMIIRAFEVLGYGILDLEFVEQKMECGTRWFFRVKGK